MLSGFMSKWPAEDKMNTWDVLQSATCRRKINMSWPWYKGEVVVAESAEEIDVMVHRLRAICATPGHSRVLGWVGRCRCNPRMTPG
jgi:hypothetical protein